MKILSVIVNHINGFISFLILVFLVLASVEAQPENNPLKGDLRVHDPAMIKQDGRYYVFHTGRGISIKTSEDRVEWKRGGNVFAREELPAWHKEDIPDQNGGLWAPDIHYRDGLYHLYYSVSAWMNFKSSIGYATNVTLDPEHPDYRWVDQGKVISFKNGGEGVNVIDPMVFTDDNGRIWLFYGSYQAGLRMTELNPETGHLISNPPELIMITPALGEGVFIIEDEDYHYIFASRGICCRGLESNYQIVMGRSEDVRGPYLTKDGKSWQDNQYTLFLEGDHSEPGRGHNGFFYENDTTFIVYHAYTRSADGRPLLNIKPLFLDEEGWPTLVPTGKLFKMKTVPFRQSFSNDIPIEIPWHGIERIMRYQPDGKDFIITNGNRRFNRALYGTNTGFRVEAGDLPEFALYLPGMGGNLKLGIGRSDSSIWLIDAEMITARYRPGSMIYEIRDPMLGRGSLMLHVLAFYEGEGMILKAYSRDIPGDLNLYWAFGGATGKKLSRDGDIGADPESSFYLKPEYCKDNYFDVERNFFTLYFGSGVVRSVTDAAENPVGSAAVGVRDSVMRNSKRLVGLVPPGCEIRISDAGSQRSPGALFRSPTRNEGVLSGKMSLQDKEDRYFIISVPQQNTFPEEVTGPSYENAHELFAASEESRKEIAGRIRVRTPDPYINTFGTALSVAADAIWEPPSYLHGSVAWRMRLPGWRGAYAADWLGWHDRARMHFRGYSKAQYTSPENGPNVPDPKTNLARQEEKAGNSLFTSGYISRRPDRINRPHHYDMNLVFIDQLLWHIKWTGDMDYAREAWPVIERHLAWEKRCFDADGNGLYNAYCCIWASDALQYTGGGVTHSSAYNYRGNLLTGRLAAMIGENPQPYLREAAKIHASVQDHLWLQDRGWYAEYKDLLGLQLVHPPAALWTMYHAIDAGLPDPFQAYQSLRYVDEEIPHIPLIAEGLPSGKYHTLSTSNWMPYTWSINNVSLAENLHTCLAYWQAGRTEKAFNLWKSQFLESMYLGASPGNFQQLSFYDAFRGELYRDFADPVGMAARTLVEGLFGIVPDALEKTLLIRPGFPAKWDHACLETPDIKFDFTRQNDCDHYQIVPSFPAEMDLQLRVKARRSKVGAILVNGREASWKNINESVGDPVIEIHVRYADTMEISIEWMGEGPEKPFMDEMAAEGDTLNIKFSNARVIDIHDPQNAAEDISFSDRSVSFRAAGFRGHRTVFARIRQDDLCWWAPICFEIKAPIEFISSSAMNDNELNFRIHNNTNVRMDGILKVNGSRLSEFSIPAIGISAEISIPRDNLVPGSNQVEFVTNQQTYRQNLVNWNIAAIYETQWESLDLSEYYNDRVENIFKNAYLSPRPNVPTLQIPVQGIGDWCSYSRMPTIDDSGIRAQAGNENRIVLEQGIPLGTPGEADVPNILFTSRWDNYPHKVSIPVSGKASHAYLLMAGSVHHMQSRIINGIIRISYSDGTAEELELVHPDTWWPIEQDYYVDGCAFRIDSPKPPRIYLKTGEVQKEDYQVLKKNVTIDIDGGAATLYDLPLDPSKELKELSLETLANDVVIGLMSITFLRNEL